MEHGQYIPGDSFYIKGLSDKPGLTFVEAKAEEQPPNENRDDDEDDYDVQIKVVVHAAVSVYGKDELEKVLSDVKDGVFGEYGENIKVLKEEVLRSEQSFHEVAVTILLDSYQADLEMKDSVFYKTFWNKHMEKIVKEGVCYTNKKVSDDLRKKLKTNIDELGKKTPIDFHPKSNDTVRDLVHPALYPFIKGVSKVKNESKVPKDPSEEEPTDFWGRKYDDSKFQWLPTPFEVTEERKIKIHEYINNLERNIVPELYDNLEDLFEIHRVPKKRPSCL